MTDEIMAFAGRKTNAEAIRDCVRLGYIGETDDIIDLTYGLGRFWTLTGELPRLQRADLDPAKSPDWPDGLDATNTGLSSASFDVAVIDPPYKLNGTSDMGGPATSDSDYGVAGDYHSREARHDLMFRMLIEGIRLVRPKGFVLYKCQAQVNGGKVRWQPNMIANWATERGMEHVDELYVEGYRPQPPGRAQKTARRNYSTLLILKRKR